MGLRTGGHRRVLFGIVMLGAAGGAGGASAQTMAATPNTMSATHGATTGLGDSHRFHSISAAASHCPSDTVVWSAGPKMTYATPSAPDYGKGGGFYACKQEADGAGFHSGG